jgi:hypothetical protein
MISDKDKYTVDRKTFPSEVSALLTTSPELYSRRDVFVIRLVND